MNDKSEKRGKVRLPKNVASDVSAADDESIKEAQQLGGGQPIDILRRQAREREINRAENFKDHFEQIAILGLYLSALCLAMIGAAILWHVIAPESLHWLKDSQVSDLRNMITGGVLAGIVAGHIKKRF